MQDIDMTFYYQSKSDVVARFSITDEWLNTKVLEPLKKENSVNIRCEIKLFDKANNHVATGHTNWQIKDWVKVKTKI